MHVRGVRRRGRRQIETSFLTVKQEFAPEKARVRTFRRLEIIFALCMLAYVFMIGRIKRSKRFKCIVKALSDNAASTGASESLGLFLRGLEILLGPCFRGSREKPG